MLMEMRIYFFLLSVIFICSSKAQDINTLNSSTVLEFDENTKHGQLANGFSYYVASNDHPSDLVTFYLVVKAGYLQEDVDQIGLSHVLEHVAFKGTEEFPKGIYFYLEKLGMSRGSQINASTGYQATTFRISVPVDSVGSINLALRIMRGLASELLLRDEDIEIERASVLAELDMASGKEQRELEYVTPKILGKSHYATRGIGTESRSNIKVFKSDKIKRFYRDWYRPDLQSIMIVAGNNVGLDSIVNKVERLFGSIPESSSKRIHKEYDVYEPDSSNSVFIFTDPEQSNFSFRIYKKMPSSPMRTVNDARLHLMGLVYNCLVQDRYNNIISRYSPPFRSSHHGLYERGLVGFAGMDVLKTIINVDSLADLKSQVLAVLTELRRIECHGFSHSEFIAARDKVKGQFMDIKSPSAVALIQSYMDHFLNGDVPINANERGRLMIGLLDKMRLEDINELSRKLLKGNTQILILVAPEKGKDNLPTAQELKSYCYLAKEICPGVFRGRTFKAYNPVSLKKVGSDNIASRIDSFGVTNIHLKNGINLILKSFRPSAGRRDDRQILIHGFAGGGALLYNGHDYYSALAAAETSRQSGLGDLDKFEFNKFLDDRNMEFTPYLTDTETGIRCRSSAGDIDLMISMIYQFFLRPKIDERSFDEWKLDQRIILDSKGADELILDTIAVYTRERYLGFDRKNLRMVSLGDSRRILKERFERLKDFNFVVTGDFDLDAVVKLFTSYLGAIPLRSKLEYASVVRQSNDSVHFDVKRFFSEIDGASVSLRFVSAVKIDMKSLVEAQAFKWILHAALVDRLREREKGVYAVKTNVQFFRLPFERLVFSIEFDCSPGRVEYLTEAVLDEISDIKRGEVDPVMYDNYLSNANRTSDNSFKSNSYWSELLSFLSYNELNNSVIRSLRTQPSLSEVVRFADLCIDVKQVMKFVILPMQYRSYY
jgi:zinc protease